MEHREISFRGKRVDNGEWFEGFYAKSGEKTYIIYDNDIAVGYVSMKEVIPETVGQYTGLTDKNGNKIFEGDILSERPPMNQIAYIGYVAYDEELAAWRFMIKNDTFNGVLLGSYSNSYKVIGNIHDTPELLNGGVTDTNVGGKKKGGEQE